MSIGSIEALITDKSIWVTTPLGEGAVVFERMSGHEALGRPFEFEVTVLSRNPAIAAESLLGQSVTVSMKLSETHNRHFNGIVTQFSNAGADANYTRYVMTLEPWFGLLNRTTDCRIFQGISALDAIKMILREQGVPFSESLNEKSYREWEYLVQYRESSFNFISRLMEQEGIYYYFAHEDGNHTMVLADPVSTLAELPGYQQVPYVPGEEGDRGDEDHLDTWHESWQMTSGAVTSRDFDFEKPKGDLTVSAQSPALDHPHNHYEVYDPPGEYQTTDEGEKVVRARLDSLQAGALRVESGGNARGIQVGALFRRSGDYMTDADPKKYLPIALSHTLSVSHYASGGGGGENDYRCSFTAIDGARHFRTPATTMKPVVLGPQTAVVVGKEGEEIWCDEHGRVMVRFHWARELKKDKQAQQDQQAQKNAEDQKTSCWVRVSQAWAGPKWGSIHIPRIGQEVIVDFLEGDPDRPIITGRVYNGDNKPPYDLPANKTQSGIKSRSTKGGSPSNFNELRFEDKKGSEEVYFQAEKDFDVLVKNDESRVVGHDRTEEVKNDETITIDGNRTETVHKDETITIDGNRTESVHKDETISITGARTETVGKDESVTVSGARTVSIGKDDSTSVGGKQILTVAKDQNVDVSGARTLNVEKDDTVSVGGKLTVTIGKAEERQIGKTLVIDVADEITIKTGDASISMKKNGDITLKGKNITLDGSGKVNVKAGGDIVLKGSKISQN